jgi:threonine dehydratase
MLSQVAGIVTVSEDEIRAAVRRLAVRAHLVAEPGGAVAVAACLFRAAGLATAGTRVAVLSGGNIEPALLADILAGGAMDGGPPDGGVAGGGATNAGVADGHASGGGAGDPPAPA